MENPVLDERTPKRRNYWHSGLPLTAKPVSTKFTTHLVHYNVPHFGFFGYLPLSNRTIHIHIPTEGSDTQKLCMFSVISSYIFHLCLLLIVWPNSLSLIHHSLAVKIRHCFRCFLVSCLAFLTTLSKANNLKYICTSMFLQLGLPC